MNGERYALHLKEPTPADVAQNHITLARMLAGTGQSAEDIAQAFSFPIEQAQGIVDDVNRIKQEGITPPPTPEYPWGKIPYVDPDAVERERRAIAEKEEEERVRVNRENLRLSLLHPKESVVINTKVGTVTQSPTQTQIDNDVEIVEDNGLSSIESEFLKGFMLGKFSFDETGQGRKKY